MLTTDLLLTRSRGPYISPRYIDAEDEKYIDLAQGLIEIFTRHAGLSRKELKQALDAHEGDRTDYRVQRGLNKLLFDDHCEFHIEGPIAAEELRREVFSAAREHHPIVCEPSLIYPIQRADVLEEVATKYQVSSEEIARGLYADLPENHLLSTFTAADANTLL